MKFLTTHSTSRTGYYLCLFMQTQFQLVAIAFAIAAVTFAIAAKKAFAMAA